MLNEGQRRERYAYQRVAIGGFDTALKEWEPTGPQRRRIKHKANKHKGDVPRSRKSRKLDELMQRIFRHETSPAEAQAEILDEVAPVNAGGKSLCSTCEPSAPDWACRTKSGKKTKDHAGRVH